MAYGVNAPFGLKPYAHLISGGTTNLCNPYKISATAGGNITYASSIFTGDVVYWNSHIANSGGGTIALGADANANPPIGVFNGCEYYDVNGVHQIRPYWAGGTPVYPGSQITCFVYDDPFIIYNIQVSTSDNTLATAIFTPSDMGTNITVQTGNGGNVVANPATGNSRTGISAAYADGAGNGDDAEFTLKVMGYIPDPQNYIYDSTGAVRPYLNLKVIFNTHDYKSVGTPGTVPA